MNTKDDFLNYINKNNDSKNSLLLKRAVNRLKVYLPEYLNVSDWDVEKIIHNFLQDNKKLSQLTVIAYKSRLNTSIKTYLSSDESVNKTNKTVSIPVPLSRGLVVSISNLPIDLTKDEANKIANVIMALKQDGGD